MLFMKGTAPAPECGFSKNAAAKLMALEIDFDTVDVQKDSKLRDAVKAFSSWPTFPQLFVEGELFGGSDIVDEMVEEGKLRRADQRGNDSADTAAKKGVTES